jgi:hypothetical protein
MFSFLVASSAKSYSRYSAAAHVLKLPHFQAAGHALSEEEAILGEIEHSHSRRRNTVSQISR